MVLVHLTEWVSKYLVYGDTAADFMRTIDETAVMDACRITANRMQAYTSERLVRVRTHPSESNKLWEQLHDMVILSSPFPGWIKRPHRIDHLLDEANYDLEEFLTAYLLDTPSETLTHAQIVAMIVTMFE